jgi:hypothetical protein
METSLQAFNHTKTKIRRRESRFSCTTQGMKSQRFDGRETAAYGITMQSYVGIIALVGIQASPLP